MTVIPVSETGIPKSDLISMAFEACRLSGYNFDRTPEESESTLRQLETMMKGWPWNALGYFYSNNEADLCNLDDSVLEGVSNALALRVMTAKGKAIPESFRPVATQSINYVRSKAATVPHIGFAPGTIRGAGAKRGFHRNEPFFQTDAIAVPTEDPGNLAGIANS